MARKPLFLDDGSASQGFDELDEDDIPPLGYIGPAELAAFVAAVAQPLDSDLTAIAALTTTAFGRSLLAAANAAALRTLAATVIGTNVQAWDADLDTLAANITAFGQSLVDDANAGAARTTLGLGTAAQNATGDFDASGAAAAAQAASQPLDADLTAIAAVVTTAFGRALLALADPADATKFLDGTGAFSVPPDTGLTQAQVLARGLGC